MPYDTTANVSFVIRILQFFGLWRLNNKYQKYYIIYARILHLSLSFPFTIMMWIDVIQAQDIEKFANTMYMSLTELMLLAKIINIWRHDANALEFFDTISTEKLFVLRNAKERQHWSKVTQRYRMIALMYTSTAVSTIPIAFVTVLFKSDYELPYPYAPPFDWRNADNYWYAYTFELMSIIVTCLSNCGLDMITYYMLLHTSLCYELIGMRLAQLGQNFDDEQRFRLELVNTIQLHQRVKSISDQCESILFFPLTVQIVCSSYVLCLSAYLLQEVRILENPSQFFILMLFVSVITLEIFLPCYCGNKIITNSNELTNEIYKSNWFQQSGNLRKFVFNYMESLKNPVTIRVGYFFDIGLPLFTTILSNTYSLVAVLLNFNE